MGDVSQAECYVVLSKGGHIVSVCVGESSDDHHCVIVEALGLAMLYQHLRRGKWGEMEGGREGGRQ